MQPFCLARVIPRMVVEYLDCSALATDRLALGAVAWSSLARGLENSLLLVSRARRHNGLGRLSLLVERGSKVECIRGDAVMEGAPGRLEHLHDGVSSSPTR
jgi:hypothetical protein